MKLSQWTKSQGISYKTAHNWFRYGNLPVKSYQTKSGTIIVEESNINSENKGTAIYSIVSSL